MFCQAQAAVQTKGVLVVFQHSLPTCGKEAMETNFHTQELFQGKYKAVLLTKSGGCDFNELRLMCCICWTNVTHLGFPP